MKSHLVPEIFQEWIQLYFLSVSIQGSATLERYLYCAYTLFFCTICRIDLHERYTMTRRGKLLNLRYMPILFAHDETRLICFPRFDKKELAE